MTICLSAICCRGNDKIFVISTDHMIDVGIGQFEHDIKKYKKIEGKNKLVVAMIAGNALLFNELLNGVDGNKQFSEIKSEIFENFKKVKKDWVTKQLLNKFGLNEKDVKDMILKPIPNPIVGKLLDNIVKFSLDTSILLVGFGDGKAKIAEINENGFGDFSDIHFHAIGSGKIQAINTLLFQKQSITDSLDTTIYNVYKAKKNAEVASGVGKDTDVLVLTEKKCYELGTDDLEMLDTIYRKELEFGKHSEDLNKLSILGDLEREESD